MKPIVRERLEEALQFCNDHDYSTEFMLQYMSDWANCSLDTVLEFLAEKETVLN